jgi:hypothetical protein
LSAESMRDHIWEDGFVDAKGNVKAYIGGCGSA